MAVRVQRGPREIEFINWSINNKAFRLRASANALVRGPSLANKACAMTKTPLGSIGVNERNSSVFRGGSWQARKKVESYKAVAGDDEGCWFRNRRNSPVNRVNGSSSLEIALNGLADIYNRVNILRFITWRIDATRRDCDKSRVPNLDITSLYFEVNDAGKWRYHHRDWVTIQWR